MRWNALVELHLARTSNAKSSRTALDPATGTIPCQLARGMVLDSRELCVTPPGSVRWATKDTCWWSGWRPGAAISGSRGAELTWRAIPLLGPSSVISRPDSHYPRPQYLSNSGGGGPRGMVWVSSRQPQIRQ